MAFLCQAMGRLHGPCEHFTYKLPMTPFSLLFIQNWNSICIQIPSALHFHMCFHLCCDILYFANLSFPFFYRSSMMKRGLTYPFAIWSKLCITFGYNRRGNTTLIYTQRHLMITFMFSNNLHCIDSTCKVVHLVMVLIGMNYCWGGPEGRMILLNLPQQWQITHPGCPSQIAHRTLREKRFLGLPSDLMIVLLVITMIPIIWPCEFLSSTSNCSYYWTQQYGQCTHATTTL